MTASSSGVRGVGVDPQTRCVHYGSPLDVVAIKMKCCDTYFACKDCHAALTGHPLEPWPREEWAEAAVLCGVCESQLSIEQYLRAANACPNCAAPFNPRCRDHYSYYFAEPHR